MENKNQDTQKQMPEHIRRMFAERRKSGEVNDADILSAPSEEQTEQQDDIKQEDATKSEEATLQQNEETSKPDEKKTKNHKISKKGWIIISCVSAVCLLGLILGLVFGLSPKYTKMQAPTVTVHALSDRTIVSVEENSDAVIYEFRISNGSDSRTIKSNYPSVTITSYLNSVGQYQIQARYIGDNERENSDYSTTYTFTYRGVLDTPIATFQENLLVWQMVDNASMYYIYYSTNEDELLYFTVQQPADTSQTVSFDLSALNESPAGKYYLYIEAITEDGSFYYNSALSAPLEYDNVKQLSAPTDVNYNRQNNTLSFTINSDIESDENFTYNFEIVINQTYTYVYRTNQATAVNIDLSPYISSQDITSLSLRALGDEIYLISSQIVTAILD